MQNRLIDHLEAGSKVYNLVGKELEVEQVIINDPPFDRFKIRLLVNEFECTLYYDCNGALINYYSEVSDDSLFKDIVKNAKIFLEPQKFSELPKLEPFSKAKAGDEVYSMSFGWGHVERISPDKLQVDFGRFIIEYYKSGKQASSHILECDILFHSPQEASDYFAEIAKKKKK